MAESNWFLLRHPDDLESPGLVFYKERIIHNIRLLLQMAPDTERLRPHVKTHKSIEVCKLLIAEGIRKFKCATVAEAEMLGLSGAPDVLLAYQPVGPNLSRFVALQRKFSATNFSCLIDNESSAEDLSSISMKNALKIDVYADVNVGMNRTGITPENVIPLVKKIAALDGLVFKGLHAYDGHIHDHELSVREAEVKPIIKTLRGLQSAITRETGNPAIIIAGGTPTFPIYNTETDFECSPGTFILWDSGYQQAFQEQKFLPAALIITRVVSKPKADLICTDLGHKAVASENVLSKRVQFVNAPGLMPISQSEEHLVLKTTGQAFEIGDLLYGLPYHICPTVALHEYATCVASNQPDQTWEITSRKRKITI